MGFASEVRPWISENLALSIPSSKITNVEKIMLDSTMYNFLNSDYEFTRYFIHSDVWIKRDNIKQLRELYYNSTAKLNKLLQIIRDKHIIEDDIIDYFEVYICLYMLESHQYILTKEVQQRMNDIYTKYIN